MKKFIYVSHESEDLKNRLVDMGYDLIMSTGSTGTKGFWVFENRADMDFSSSEGIDLSKSVLSDTLLFD